MKVIVYTANINNYDTRKPIVDVDRNTQYLYYSENKKRISGWQIMPVDMNIHNNPKKISRYYKTNSHLLPMHDYSIWIDASFQINPLDILSWVKKHLGNKDIACFFHGKDDPNRCCIYQEAAACINKFPEQSFTILDQINKYRDEEFPQKFGLRSAGIIIRRNNENVKKFNELWWHEIEKGSHRDQLSQMYVSWKTGIEVGKIKEGTVYVNELARYGYHIHKLEALKNKTLFKRV